MRQARWTTVGSVEAMTTTPGTKSPRQWIRSRCDAPNNHASSTRPNRKWLCVGHDDDDDHHDHLHHYHPTEPTLPMDHPSALPIENMPTMDRAASPIPTARVPYHHPHHYYYY